jgi:two-component system, NarL family, sensor histidine kinase UhpB
LKSLVWRKKNDARRPLFRRFWQGFSAQKARFARETRPFPVSPGPARPEEHAWERRIGVNQNAESPSRQLDALRSRRGGLSAKPLFSVRIETFQDGKIYDHPRSHRWCEQKLMMPQFAKAPASLRARLILIPPVFLLLGIVAAIGAALVDAPDRVAAETASGLEIGGQLIAYALDNISRSADPDIELDRVLEKLSNVRHIRVGYSPSSGSPVPVSMKAPSANSAPNWFVNLFVGRRDIQGFPLDFHGARHGMIVMVAEPRDEVDEIWNELTFLIGLLSAISAGIIVLTWLAVSYALRPLRELVEGFNRLERGRFDEIGKIRVSELQRVGEQFNRLAKSLSRTEADNRLLIDRLMSIQESERKELARELHDEFGASLFGIRASVSCIVQAAAMEGPAEMRFTEIAERAHSISSLTDRVQKQNYRILERIRPIAIDEMGLFNWIRHLADGWTATHRVVCHITTPETEPKLGSEESLAVYRIVQECLTNIARHSVRVASKSNSRFPRTGVLLSASRTMALDCQTPFAPALASSA